MTPLPNLDDRRWLDLVEEGKALIPALSPQWTDHNASDPGITLLELFAWVAEMDVYQLNRVPERHRLKFLSLLSRHPQTTRAARAVVEMQLASGAAAMTFPAGVEFEADGPDEAPLRYASLAEIIVSQAVLQAIQVSSGGKPALVSGSPFAAFGDEPKAGAALYLGFDAPDAAAFPMPLRLWFELDGDKTSLAERERVAEEQRLRSELCEKLDRNPCGCATEAIEGSPVEIEGPSVRLVWEYAVSASGGLTWQPLVVQDETHALTFKGAVQLALPGDATNTRLGAVDAPLRWVRARLDVDCYDVPPRIVRVAVNAVQTEQAIPFAEGWTIRAGITPQGAAPLAGDSIGLHLSFNARREIEALAFVDTEPRFRVLGYEAPTAQADGRLTLEAAWLGTADGGPHQQYQTPENPVVEDSFALWTLEGEWRAWEAQTDFDRSTRRDRHYTLDGQTGGILFGDGEKGVAPPDGALVFASFRFTAGPVGNVKENSIIRISGSAANRVLLGDPQAVAANLAVIRNPVPATGGADAETLSRALGLAIEDREASHRAVTLQDFEALALSVPGTNLARAVAKANYAPGFNCWTAPGFVTVTVIPNRPGKRPRPTAALLSAVRSYLDRRRLIGTRVEVVGPDYVEVVIQVRVKALPGKSRGVLAREISDRLDRFLNPLTGGPEGGGWPLGRSVYPAETLQVIDETPGVDYASGLLLARGGCPPSCGALHLPPNGLPAAGAHSIEVA